MDIENMKNMVVLRNLPSNLIQEAFVVLKDNVKVHKEEFAGNKKEENKLKNKNDKDYVVKEAEMIISEYIHQIDKKQFKNVKEKTRIEEKCKKLKFLSIFFGVFSLLCSIGLIIR